MAVQTLETIYYDTSNFESCSDCARSLSCVWDFFAADNRKEMKRSLLRIHSVILSEKRAKLPCRIHMK